MSDFENLDYYELLGVSRSATADEIKRAYRQEIAKYHPDRYANASPAEREYAGRRSQYITVAYSVLNNPSSRTAYNRGQAGRTSSARPTPPPPPQPRDHQAELYEQAREHLAAQRLLQAIGTLRQLQQINPFYRDSADMLASAEAQLRELRNVGGERRSRRPLLLIGSVLGGVAALALIAVVINMSRDSDPAALSTNGITQAAQPTEQAVIAPSEAPAPTTAPPEPTTAPPEPTAVVAVVPTSEPTLALTSEPTATPTSEPTATPTSEPTATPTNEPTATPTSEPTATVSSSSGLAETGTLLFSDDFSGSGWADTGGAGWRVGYQNGQYRIAVDAGYGTIWSYHTTQGSNMSIGVDMQVTSGEGGLLVRFLDANNYMYLVVNPQSSSWRLEQRSGGVVSTLASGQSDAIRTGSATNRLVARLNGDYVQMLINGTLVAELDATTYGDNARYGLLAVGGSVSSEAFFDNLQVRALE